MDNITGVTLVVSDFNMKEVPFAVREAVYSTQELLSLVKVNRERLRDWEKQGHFKARCQADSKHGQAKFYSFEEVLRCLALRVLIDNGFKRELAAKLTSKVQVVALEAPTVTITIDWRRLAETLVSRIERL